MVGRRAWGEQTVIFVSTAAVFCSGMGTSLLTSTWPPFARSVGLTEFQSGIVVSAGLAIFALVAPFWGRKADTLGRHIVLGGGLIGNALGLLLFGLAIFSVQTRLLTGLLGFSVLVAARCLSTFFGSSTYPAAQATVTDVTGQQNRAAGIGQLSAGFGAGLLVGPGAGAILVSIGFFVPFFALAFIAASIGLLVYAMGPIARWERPSKELASLSMTDRRMRPYLVTGFALFTAVSCYQQTLAFYFQDRLILTPVRTAQIVGIVLMTSAFCSLFSQSILIRALKISALKLMMLGVCISLLGFVTLLLSSTVLVLGAGCIAVSLGFSLSSPANTAASTLAIAAHEQGAAAGILSSARAVGLVAGSLIGTGLYRTWADLPFTLCCVSLIGLFVYFMGKTMLPRPSSNQHL